MFNEESPKSNLRRWDEIIALLSLDVVHPFFDLMGLNPSLSDKLQRVMRQEIIAGRKKAAIVTGTGQLTPLEFIRVVHESLGVDTSSHLVWWNHHVFLWDSTQDNVDLRKWTTIIQHCSREPNLWARLDFPDNIGPEQYCRSRNLGEYQSRQDEVDAQPLSDWDLHIYALRLYDDNLYDNSSTQVADGPRLYVKPTVRAYQGYQFWNRALKEMSPGQREHLWQEARRIAHLEELIRNPETLPHPSVLDIWA